MPSVSGLYPSKFLKPIDIADGDALFTIRAVREEPDMKGNPQLVLSFRETSQSFSLNSTNARTIGSIHGDDYSTWVGKPVTFYVTPVQSPNGIVDGIRVRIPARKPSRPAPSQASDVRYPQPVARRTPVIPQVEPPVDDEEDSGSVPY